uniref:RNA-directed RNA polymerase n=1 Tax=Rhizopus stolonifer toti-like virus 1 TaxID=3071459 RepID=A0AA50QDT6_9VIRU|nr:RdRp [Rhizopus stolonifer toti-like virus 1]
MAPTPGRAATLAKQYGRLGYELLRVLVNNHIPLTLLENLPTTDQLITASQMISSHPDTPLIGVGVSLLLADFPVQVPMNSMNIIKLCKLMFPPTMPTPHIRCKKLTMSKIMNRDYLQLSFPFKHHPAATTKTNVTLYNLLQALKSEGNLLHVMPLLSALAFKVTNDQACAAILYALGLHHDLGPYAYEYAAQVILEPKLAKMLSTALKALGCNSDIVGAKLVEGDTLQGRGVGSVDLREEATYRCDPEAVAQSVVNPPLSDLRQAIRDILEEEINPDELMFQQLDLYWSGRWAWCVNGSHSRVLDRQGGLDTVNIFPGVDRIYRRMYAEAQEIEPISSWDGEVYVSASEKLEHGKTRAIFACDTLSYFAFQHLLSGIEKSWRGRRVILDPGSQGHLGIANRILTLRKGGGVSVMLDYDDFNSAHSTQTMQVLFEELTTMVGYDQALASNLIRSFERENIYCKGKYVGLAKGTLMSGHRATTFINSVLNAAYVRVAVGRAAYEDFKSVHVGDDIYICVPTHSHAAMLLTKTRELGCRMNPMKQSVGLVGAEFLRMGIRDTHAIGYFARSVASAVSGNWVSEARLSPRDALRTAIATVHTLQNRSGYQDFSRLLARPLSRLVNVNLKTVRALLSGALAIEGSPQFVSDGSIRTVKEVMPPPDQLASELPKEWPTHATTDYLTVHASGVEQVALQMLGKSVFSAMLVSSYNKTLTSEITLPPTPRYTKQPPRVPVGSTSASVAMTRGRVRGILEPYPILQLIKDHLSKEVIRELFKLLGADPGCADIDTAAWGAERRTHLIHGAMSYSDAAALSANVDTGVLYTRYPVYM